MKQNIKSAEVELDQNDLHKALVNYAKDDRKVLELAVNKYLTDTHKEFFTKRIAVTVSENGELIVKADVSADPSDLAQTIIAPLREATNPQKKKRSQLPLKATPPPTKNGRFANLGFFSQLVNHLAKHRGEEVTFDNAWVAMHKAFPDLDKRKFGIYVRDKRQQKARGVIQTKTGLTLGKKGA